MRSSWFWIKFALLIVITVGVGLFSLPQSWLDKLPQPISAAVSDYPVKLGIDLSGGTKLEYQIDFTEAEKKARLASASDEEFEENFNKEQISDGVVETLKKRIDPDGTKEVGVFASQRGEDWFVVVELTADIDTPENREKLEKVTSLSFKEPFTSVSEVQESADILLSSAISNKTLFEDFADPLVKGREGNTLTLENATSEELTNAFNDNSTAEEIMNMDLLGWYSKKIELEPGIFIFVYFDSLPEQKEATFTEDDGTEYVEEITVRSLRLLYYQGQWKETPLGGAQFKVAKVGTDPNTNFPVTSIEFTPAGAALFSEITGRLSQHVNPVCGSEGDQFAIFVDGDNISAPCVRERIDGNAQISFGGTSFQEVQKEASELAESLNSGATPAPVTLISERKISASLGERALELSVKAAVFGFVAVAVWMIFFFRWFGLLAIIALGFYSLVLMFLFQFFGFVLTLAGVAGIILSIGMAVDANVLIFERVREELRDGQKFYDAVQTGFDRAWTSIRDSNISSLITCFILFALGTSIIKAFAITLAIGILVSMFTAIGFTRYLILALTPSAWKKKPSILVSEKSILNN